MKASAHCRCCCPAGTELYPRVGPVDIKTWTNCRMGMMSWTFINVCFAFKQLEIYGYVSNSMLVSVILSGTHPTQLKPARFTPVLKSDCATQLLRPRQSCCCD